MKQSKIVYAFITDDGGMLTFCLGRWMQTLTEAKAHIHSRGHKITHYFKIKLK